MSEQAYNPVEALAARVILAVADKDKMAYEVALREAAEIPRGVPLLITALANTVIGVSEQLDPEWTEQLRAALLATAIGED